MQSDYVSISNDAGRMIHWIAIMNSMKVTLETATAFVFLFFIKHNGCRTNLVYARHND